MSTQWQLVPTLLALATIQVVPVSESIVMQLQCATVTQHGFLSFERLHFIDQSCSKSIWLGYVIGRTWHA
jgi:hypothetical protein